MIKIYAAPSRAIICDERLKVFYYTTKEDAVILSKGVDSRVVQRQGLSYTTEMLLSVGYEEIKK